jgi:cytochrome c-type biogenesis protein CcmH
MEQTGMMHHAPAKTPILLMAICLFSALMTIILGGGRVLAQGGAATAAATREVTANDVNRVSRGLYCPVCQNVPLEVCETTACERWREQVRELLQQGYTDEQIRQYFVQNFGSKTVGTPTDMTSQILTIALPLGLIAAIGAGIAITLIGWRRIKLNAPQSESAPPETTTDAPDDYRARLEEELRKRD